jgi:lipoprotein NlpI
MLNWLTAAAYCVGGAYRVRTGKYSAAISLYSKATQIDPNHHFARIERGVAFQGIRDHNSAISDFDRVIAMRPRWALAYFNRGISWKLLGDIDRAGGDQVQAITLNPKFAIAFAELAVLHSSRDDDDNAITYLTQAIELAPRNRHFFKLRGYSFFYQANYDAAAADLRYSLISRLDIYAVLFLYLARTRTGHRRQAVPELEWFAEKLRSQQWPAVMIGLFLGKLSAEAALAAASAPDERAEAQFYLGAWHLLQNNWIDAIAAFRMAAQSCPPYFVEYSAARAELKRLEGSNTRG